MSHFNVSLIVWTKSQDSVHKPQFLKRKESRSGSNLGPSAYQPSALPLGHTGPQNADLSPFVAGCYTPVCRQIYTGVGLGSGEAWWTEVLGSRGGGEQKKTVNSTFGVSRL